jgi:2,4-dienoyl-CoA reductase (NADPH2)
MRVSPPLMSKAKFERLLEPYQIGSVKTRNRMVKSSAATWYWGVGENQVTDKVRYFYEALARGGVGLIIIDNPSMDGAKRSIAGGFYLNDDMYIKGLIGLTQLIHGYDCPVFIQLGYGSNWQKRMAWQRGPASEEPRGPSPVCVYSEMDNHNQMPREMRIDEIQEIISKFGNVAVRAQKAGFDGIEINASCSHLLHSFLSPFWNKRQDIYGGSLENRARFVVEVIKEIKKRLGKDYPISVNINGIESGKLIGVDARECLSLDDSRGIARILQEAGADALQIRSHWIGRHDGSILPDHFYYPEPPVPPESFPPELDRSRRGAGVNALIAGAIKKEVTIPVMTVGRLDPFIGEEMLRKGLVDYVCFNRRLIADPELPNKVAAGRLDDITPCTSCTTCKVMGGARWCRINAAFGLEQPYTIEKALQKKRVVIVGGGPAGMEAARVSAIRGHKVVLFEKTDQLGGSLPMASVVKGLEIEDLAALVTYLKGQIVKLGVDIRIGKKPEVSDILKLQPDVVILATGGMPALPDIPGINNPKVMSPVKLHRQLKFFLRYLNPRVIRRLTRFYLPVGKRVVIIGGGINGCELAEFLVKRGRQVTIVDSAEVLGEGLINHLKNQLFWWFNRKGVNLLPGVKPVEITDKGLIVLTREGYRRTLKADSIIPAMPLKPNSEMLNDLKGKVKEVYAIGDCLEPHLIVDAIAGGYRTGRSL